MKPRRHNHLMGLFFLLLSATVSVPAAEPDASGSLDQKVFLTEIDSNLEWVIDKERYTWYLKPNTVQYIVLQPQTLWDEWRKRLAAERPGDEPTHSVSTRPAVPGPDGLMPSVPIDEYADHLEAIIRRIRERTKARVYLLTFTVITDDYHRTDWTAAIRDRQRAVYDAYRDRMRAVGRAMGVPVVDVYPRFLSTQDLLVFPDGIHPNARGSRIYAEELYKQIRQELGL